MEFIVTRGTPGYDPDDNPPVEGAEVKYFPRWDYHALPDFGSYEIRFGHKFTDRWTDHEVLEGRIRRNLGPFPHWAVDVSPEDFPAFVKAYGPFQVGYSEVEEAYVINIEE